MILELDCGISLIKWRILRGGEVVASGVAGVAEAALSQLAALALEGVAVGRMVSVRSEAETSSVVELFSEFFCIDIHVVRSIAELAGVRNGYLRPDLLGADRWMAIVAGYQMVGHACVILDLGTAVTADFIDAKGAHLGGFIAPGINMMRDRLSTQTKRVGSSEAVGGVELANVLPGDSTACAVSRGCLLMLRGFAQAQLQLARGYFGSSYSVLITGGDGFLLEDIAPEARIVPDLVFQGLRLACPLGDR